METGYCMELEKAKEHYTLKKEPHPGESVQSVNAVTLRAKCCPGQVVQLVGVLFWYAEVLGLIPIQGTYKKQLIMHKYIEQQIDVSLSFSLSLSPPFLPKINLK